MLLCTVEQFKARFGFSGTADDAAIESVIAGASAQIGAAAGRDLAEADRTVELSISEPGLKSLWLPAWPISRVTKMESGFDGSWTDSDELIEGEDFRVDARLGRLISLFGCFGLVYRDVFTPVLRVRWTGGYTLPGDPVMVGYNAWVTGTVYAAKARVTSGAKYYRCITGHTAAALFATDLAAGKWVEDTLWAAWAASADYRVGDRRMVGGRYYHCTTAHTGAAEFGDDYTAGYWHEDYLLPDDLVEAAVQQAGYVWQRRANLGMSGGSAGQGGSFSAADNPDDLLPAVKGVCARYRRMIA